MKDKHLSPEYIVTHQGDEYERFHGAVVTPIYENSLFVFKDFTSFTEAMRDETENYIYWRGNNPTVEVAEKKLAALEGGDACKLFSSGMAAITSAILSCVQAGDHVLCVSNIYGPAKKLLTYLEKFHIETTTIFSTETNEIERSIKSNTRVIYLESPTTMTFKLVDLPAVSKMAKQKGISTIIDNTWATPLYQKPLKMGIDIVVHSASKYLGGHSDLVGGVLVTNEARMKELFVQEFQLLGGVMPPFEAWMLTRGLRTLPIRMKQHQESTRKISTFLENHHAVKQVNYPGLPTNPYFELGRSMLEGYSGLLSFELKENNYHAVKKVIDSLAIFQIGVSWGGFESLVLSPNYGNNEQQLKEQNLDPGLIRLSIGLENTEELLEDLEKSLHHVVTTKNKREDIK
ncbi:trans-sulfuration enzyme family protein [Pseudalkalibacillus caeni]|uniref:homocysteine desulfhydrase n=1 Tax=Exobacillus caeni TaxID=2574798 RepID=A0A5R9FGH2_9BACL|nr:PLP-dependent aspartate aminotransferase family protein [Pseudalkalibacillus caeni]TLS38635.1 PLP-dependent transferase [Pseudalkalibacillus caeni]